MELSPKEMVVEVVSRNTVVNILPSASALPHNTLIPSIWQGLFMHLAVALALSQKVIAKGRGQKAVRAAFSAGVGRREKIDGSRFQYLARVLITLATAIPFIDASSN
jgi:hypothetical protein